jgi:hypothetical protein
MLLDAHGHAELAGGYLVRSLYLDTPELDTFLRSPGYRKCKFRIRGYVGTNGYFLERKFKKGQKVRKQRIEVEEASRLAEALPDATWAGEPYRGRIVRRRLQPTCWLGYERVAFVGQAPEGPMRLTLDRNVRCAPAQGWSLHEPQLPRPLLAGQVVLELKFRTALPVLFKQLVEEQRLAPQPASKYRLAVQAWGLDQRHKEAS